MMGYRIDVNRRNASDNGYEAEPYAAVATFGKRVVAIQYGSQPGIAFQRAWNAVQRDREREPVTATAPLPA